MISQDQSVVTVVTNTTDSPLTNSADTTPDHNNSEEQTNDTDGNTVADDSSANPGTNNDTTSLSPSPPDQDNGEKHSTDSVGSNVTDDPNSHTSVTENDNVVVKDCCCDHSDFVPRTEYLSKIEALESQITALRSALQLHSQTCKIERDDLTTQVHHLSASINKAHTPHNSSHSSHKQTKKLSPHSSKSPSPYTSSPPPSPPPVDTSDRTLSTSPKPKKQPSPQSSKSPSPHTSHPPPPPPPQDSSENTDCSVTAISSTPHPTSPSPHPLLKVAVAKDTTVILLGDTTVNSVDLTRFTPHYEVCQTVCANGLTVSSLTEWLIHQPPTHRVKQAIFHVGVSDCCETSSSPPEASNVTTQQWTSLIAECQRVFPKAQIQASSIIPARGRNLLNTIIRPSNMRLEDACSSRRVKLVDHTPTFITHSGAPRMALYRNAIQPSERGLVHMCQSFFPVRRRPLLPTPSHPPCPTQSNTQGLPRYRNKINTSGRKTPPSPPPVTQFHYPNLPSSHPPTSQQPTPVSTIRSTHSSHTHYNPVHQSRSAQSSDHSKPAPQGTRSQQTVTASHALPPPPPASAADRHPAFPHPPPAFAADLHPPWPYGPMYNVAPPPPPPPAVHFPGFPYNRPPHVWPYNWPFYMPQPVHPPS